MVVILLTYRKPYSNRSGLAREPPFNPQAGRVLAKSGRAASGATYAATTEVRIGLEADSSETIKQGVMAGLGIAFISAHTVSQELQTGQLVSRPLAEFPVVRAWYIVQNPQRDASPATIALRDYIERESATFIPQFSQAA